MNLATDQWIPVIDFNQDFRLVSLEDLFHQAESIGDLAVNPAQRIALLQLLICIAQTALDGPQTEKDWLQCRQAIQPEVRSYLAQKRQSFDLTGSRPFMQAGDLECDPKGKKILKALDCRTPFGGSASIHFARDLADRDQIPPPAQTALDLLCLLNFSPGGKVGQAIWQGQTFNGSTFQAPALKTMHTFIRGESLLATIWLNLICKKGPTASLDNLPNLTWGRPVWERFPAGPDDKKAISNATTTYLGRLVPLSRLVRILPGEKGLCIIGPPPESFKIEQLPGFRNPFATVIEFQKEHSYLNVSSSRHIWRDLGSVISLADMGGHQQAALPLARIKRLCSLFNTTAIEIWSGGLETGATAAKLNDLLEWNLTLPVAQFEQSALARYKAGVELAGKAEKLLKKAIGQYWKNFQRDTKAIPYSKAGAIYWAELDSHYNLLVETASNQVASLNDTWYPLVRRAMEMAYSKSCPHVSARQIQVFAAGLAELRLKKLEE